MNWLDRQKERFGVPASKAPPPKAGKTPGSGPNLPTSRTWLVFLLVLLANYMLVRFLFPEPNAPLSIPYTTFKEEVAKGNVEAIYSKGDSIEGRFGSAVTWPPPGESKAPTTRSAARETVSPTVVVLVNTTNAESCAAYNMLKVARNLFSHAPDGRFMDYYEKALV
ncbi:MAG: ATP-dependent metallopeptidase FtsH/Yme1/Tma family protein, partial [Gammaproteobacteria bacterium]